MIGLVDCNSFYCSVESVFRPDLAGKPVVVLSNNDGCVVARSAAAKELGVEMAAPWHQVPAALAAKVSVFSSNYPLIGDFSQRVFNTLSSFAERIERYSVDESFLEFAPGPRWDELGATIRQTVRRNTGIPVSVGFASTKVLAKVANKIAKKTSSAAGVFVLEEVAVDAALAALAPEDIWGIGGRLGQRLRANGVRTALDLKHLDADVARRLLTVVGQRISLELQGIPCLSIEEVAPAKKSICTARSFGRPIETLEDLREPLASYVSAVAEKLRKQGSVAGRMQIFLHTNPFKPAERQLCPGRECVLSTPTNFTSALVGRAQEILTSLWRPGYRWHRVGVVVMDLVPERTEQLAFDSPPIELMERRRRAMAAMDRVNQSFGRGTLHVGSAAANVHTSAWKMRQASLSPRYTTSWSELPEVGI
jgi:DNA polymerase V